MRKLETICTEFAVKRDRYDGCVVDIQCGGNALEPEIVTPPIMPQDGDILTSRTYDEMKAARSRQGSRPRVEQRRNHELL